MFVRWAVQEELKACHAKELHHHKLSHRETALRALILAVTSKARKFAWASWLRVTAAEREAALAAKHAEKLFEMTSKILTQEQQAMRHALTLLVNGALRRMHMAWLS